MIRTDTTRCSAYFSSASSCSTTRAVPAVLLLLQVSLLLVLYLTASLFWAEAVGLWLIAAHYLWHSGRHARNLVSDEPTQVLERLFEPCYRLIVVLLKPSTWSGSRSTDLERTRFADLVSSR